MNRALTLAPILAFAPAAEARIRKYPDAPNEAVHSDPPAASEEEVEARRESSRCEVEEACKA